MARTYTQIGLLFVLMMMACQVLADRYDPLLLRAQATIFPKIILLDQDLEKKTPGNEVIITIVSTIHDSHAANKLKQFVEDKYSSSLGNKKLIVNVSTFDEFEQESLASAYIVLNGSELSVGKIVSYASSHERIVFSYSYSEFIYDVLISLHVKEKTYVYLNKSAMQLYGIRFMPVFYKITKIIE
ncbi:MAG: hypothetical protein KAS57_00485 [Gammaproteobacteria bacterium]|nr:hypothetical protein [Gammaproteobacteria bacterium]